MLNQSKHLAAVDKDLFERVMRMADQISQHEMHFNDLQTQYRKLASTWLLAAFAACGYILKSARELPFDEWYFVFGICMAASAGLSILWIMDLKVYQKLLGAFFAQGVYLELTYYEWLCPFRINIMRSQPTGEVRSKVQYFYFFSITVLQLLAVISLCNWKIFSGRPASKALYSAAIVSITLTVLGRLLGIAQKRKKAFKDAYQPESGDLTKKILKWKSETDAEKDTSSH